MKRMVCHIILLIYLVSMIQCQSQQNAVTNGAGDIAVYSDRGVWPESVRAAEKMFQWMGYSTGRVDAGQIRGGALENFRVLCVPGGDMYQYAQDLSSRGVGNIRSFVSDGGGYIGICGGAYFAGEKVVWRNSQLPMISLALFSGSSRGPYDQIVPYPDSAMCLVNIVNDTHPITNSIEQSPWILYFWGPALLPDGGADVDTLGKYSIIDEPAMLALEYGSGRAFLIGAHPEIEEDSDRDGVTECDELEDQGSDWDLMRAAARWCLKE